MICTTYRCDERAIAPLTVRRPCGHPVSLNSSYDRPHVVDGTPAQKVQRQWTCKAHVLERAGQPAPGPSTCPTCGVREPVTTDPLVHAAHPTFATSLCREPLESGESIAYDRSERITCPGCLEWIGA